MLQFVCYCSSGVADFGSIALILMDDLISTRYSNYITPVSLHFIDSSGVGKILNIL